MFKSLISKLSFKEQIYVTGIITKINDISLIEKASHCDKSVIPEIKNRLSSKDIQELINIYKRHKNELDDINLKNFIEEIISEL